MTGTTNQFNRSTDFNFDSTPVWCRSTGPFPQKPSSRDAQSQLQRAALCERSGFSRQLRGGNLPRARDPASGGHVITTNGNGLPTGPFCTSNRRRCVGFPGSRNHLLRANRQRSDTQYAGFGEATWKITDAWTAVAGLRYFTERWRVCRRRPIPSAVSRAQPGADPIRTDLQQGHLEGQQQLQVQR